MSQLQENFATCFISEKYPTTFVSFIVKHPVFYPTLLMEMSAYKSNQIQIIRLVKNTMPWIAIKTLPNHLMSSALRYNKYLVKLIG